MENKTTLDRSPHHALKKTIGVSLFALYNAAIIASQIYSQVQLTSLQDKYDKRFDTYEKKLTQCNEKFKGTTRTQETDVSSLVNGLALLQDFVQADRIQERNKREVLSSDKIDLSSLLRGRDGRDGKDGAVGPQGPPGRDGLQGPAGVAGKDGLPGRDGKDSVNLAFVNHVINATVTKMVSTEMEKVKTQAKNIPTVSGATYTRWGRTTCPKSSNLIYKGRAGGTYYSQTGGSPESLCMPDDPEYSSYNGTYIQSRINGVEYHFDKDNAHSKLISGYAQNVPCVLCQTQLRPIKVTFPAKLKCPDSSWRKEYSGFLVTSGDGQQRTNYLCVDKDAEPVPEMGVDEQGRLLSYVGVQCGGTGNLGHCPPYKTNSPITCTVCTK